MNKRKVKMVVAPLLLFFLGALALPTAQGGTFHCPAQPDNLKIIAFGDSRPPYHPNKIRLLEAMKKERPDLFLHLGDMVFDSAPEDWQRFDLQEGKLATLDRPLLPVVGNHEKKTHSVFADAMVPFFERFPTLEGKPWYEYQCGALRLLVLSYVHSLKSGAPQREWLEEQVAKEEGDFLLVAIHDPPYTGMPDYPLPEWESILSPLFQWARNHRGVDMVLSGHVHSYERYQEEGSTFIVSGGGGSYFYTFPRSSQDLYQGREPGLHYLRMWINSQELTLEMVAATDSFATSGEMEVLDKVVLPVRKKP
ncbi:MAG: hypothetical protein G8345_00970 [Magnetococcales bacterium]|nr:metallophosphoesterase [Magnetococcales bacterium]NGZ25441.1 hypothetical protein [Magnetococcales bacterium]